MDKLECTVCNKSKFIPAARFSFLSPLFDALCAMFGFGKKYRKQIIDALNLSDKKIRVLDAGCGTGSLAVELKKNHPNIELTTFDADPKILKIAKEKATKKIYPLILKGDSCRNFHLLIIILMLCIRL